MSLTFRVYLCSHFTDTKPERDHLHEVVFPELRRRLAASGCSLDVVDLRRPAASEAEAEDPLRLPEALHKIGECRPWFLCLLGDSPGSDRPREHYARYLDHPTRQAEAQACQLALNELAQAEPELRGREPASRLEVEVWHGVLRRDRPAAGLVYCRDRRAAGEDRARVEDLRRRLEESERAVVRPYTILADDSLTAFGQAVLADLSAAMDAVFRVVVLDAVQESGALYSRIPEPGEPMEMTARIIRRTLAGRDLGTRPVAMRPVAAPSPPAPKRPIYVDENVQFTVYRPRVVAPEKWYPMLAFAHLSERAPDAPPGTPDPVEEVYRQAKQVLGSQAKDYQDVTQDSRAAVPREGELTLVPEVPGVQFNPPRRSFLWTEPVHREEFRLKASAALDGKTVRGRLTVFLGSVILADVSLSFRVDSGHRPVSDEPEAEKARAYRKIFASYSHQDMQVVQQVEQMARVFGDRYLRDWTELRAGEVWDDRLMEMIRDADVFQLFWSHNSMRSPHCRREWEYALSLARPYFVRPTYWEEPLPATPDGSLPPEELRRLHFQRIFAEALTHPQLQPPAALDKLYKLSDVVERDEKLEQLLSATLESPQKQKELAREMKAEAPPPPAAPAARAVTGPLRAKLERVRRPRVRLSYDVETAGAEQRGELPFVIGVLADLSGQPAEPMPFASRRFVLIDRDNFNDVLSRLAPRLALTVPNRLGAGADAMGMELHFRNLDDFRPERVAARVEPIRQLLAARGQNPGEAAEIDRWLSAQLCEILHHPDFQRLESAWRGLHHLVQGSETGQLLRIRVLNASRADLQRDQGGATTLEQSALFQKLHEEYTAPGGEPFGLLVGDYEFDASPESVSLLQRLTSVAASVHAPLIAAASPRMFGLERFSDLSGATDLSRTLAQPDHAAWNAFRDSEDARFVALALPQVLARIPYGERSSPVEGFAFEELPDAAARDGRLWMSAAWAYATCVADAFARDGWPARILGPGQSLPTWTAPQDGGGEVANCPMEVAFSNRRQSELHGLGVLPLLPFPGGGAVFLTSPSCHRPKRYDSATVEPAERLNHLLCASRFMHYLRVMVRNRLGSFQEPGEYERWLNGWLAGYVLPSPEGAGEEDRVRRPLLEGRVEVQPIQGEPGHSALVAWLRPNIGPEPVPASLRLVAEVPVANPVKEPSRGSRLPLIVSLVLGLAAVAGVVWWFFLR